MRKRKKTYDDDDGRVIIDMNVDGFRWHNKNLGKTGAERQEFTKKERRTIRRSAMIAALPVIAIMLAALAGAYFIIYFWLH